MFAGNKGKEKKNKKNQTGEILAFWEALRFFLNEKKKKPTSMLLVLMVQKIGWEGVRNAKRK